MKICPECSAQYEDSINFCAKDGRALAQKTIAQTRLCPHCANSIPEDAVTCPYCKAEVGAASAPQWPTRENDRLHAGLATHKQEFPTSAKVALLLGIGLCVLGVFLIGKAMLGRENSSETRQLAEEKIKELQEKEQKIQALEGQLTQVRRELGDASGQLAALKVKLEESEKELSTTRQRLNVVSREVDRLTSLRVQPSPAPAPRPSADPSPPSPPLPARRSAEPGLYEVVRPTPVHEEPSTSSRVLSQIRKGTKVTVVRSVGDWLEVRSKHDNPPGFVRRDDAMYVGRAN